MHQGDAMPDGARRGARIDELDGIRGWAALVVVVFHLGYETFGAVVPAFRSPLVAAANGRWAVALFFILSGEALSAAYFRHGDVAALASLAVRRHSRLSIPVFASVLLFGALSAAGLVFNGAAGAIVARPDWLGGDGRGYQGLAHAVTYCLVGMYQGPSPDVTTNPFTWTMTVEFAGSFVVFALAPMIAYLKRPQTTLAIVVVVSMLSTTTSFIGAFVAGMLFARWRVAGTIAALRSRPAMPWIAAAGIVVCLAASSYCLLRDYHRLNTAVTIGLAASLYASGAAHRFFTSRVSLLLGRLSFSLYLVQWSVLTSFTSYLIVRVGRAALTPGTAVAIVAASVAVCLLAAVAFEPVEMVTQWIGRRLSAAAIGRAPASRLATTGARVE